MTGMVAQIRKGSREELMAWYEASGVDYVFGRSKSTRLKAILAAPLTEAERQSATSGKPARLFRHFRYRTRDSWSRERRVMGKAEHTLDGGNPRFEAGDAALRPMKTSSDGCHCMHPPCPSTYGPALHCGSEIRRRIATSPADRVLSHIS